MGYSPWGHKESDTTEVTWHTCTHIRSLGWEDPLEEEWQPAPIFLPGESQGQRSLAGYGPWGCKRVRHDLETKQEPTKKKKRRFGELSGI